ncbi:MAG: exo-beta-N-acetylmuramidase NamZ family protein, partial [Dissulfurimicrobium sp.]
RVPEPWQLYDIELFLVDIQDIGCRVYTFIWTMYLAMKACAKAGIGMVVLDRPNPIGGCLVEGNLLDEGLKSFVGLAPIPMRHGMTVGELARFFVWLEDLDLELHVVRMDGWRRDMDFQDTGLPWIWPSPNIPTVDTALVYPGQVVLEGTNLSEGRGTTRPFEVFGAPYLDIVRFKSAVERLALPGFVLREQYFEPTFHKWAGKRCRGFQIHVIDKRRYRPYLTTLSIVSLAKKLHPIDFQWREPPYEYDFERLPIDLIIGSETVRKAVEVGDGLEGIESLWHRDMEEFLRLRSRFLLY